jgi:cellulose synthase (UDP-forming)
MTTIAAFCLWLVASAVFVFVASVPIDVESQFLLAACCLAIMAGIKLLNLRGPIRSVFLGIGTFLILRYFFWRVTSTLPPVSSPLDFTAGLVLVLAEIYCIAMMFLSLFSVADPIERPAAPTLSDAQSPTVDVFVPTYNESLEIVASTAAAAKNMDYPADKLKVYVLDDGGTDEKVGADDPDVAAQAANRRRALREICSELGVNYVTRERNLHAKAGNLNNGLARSDGDIVVVFDADHAPDRQFLKQTVGYFATDEKLFLVQTPHFFLNPDPVQKNLGLSGMPAENEMFYALVQKGLDKWNAAFFCGSAALLRRQALEEVGGFHGSSVTEDVESALELHSRGWNSLYVDKPMIAGLQPETFASFIGQRSRWCRGMVQILMLKNPLFVSGLTMAQRLCYLSSSLFWLFPLSRIVFILAPMAYIFFDLKIYVANSQEFVAYTFTYMLAALLIQSYVFGRVRWPWTSDLYEYAQSVLLFPAVLGVLIDPRRPKFNVTAKGQTIDDSGLSALAAPYFGMFALVAASLVMLAFRFVHEPQARSLMTVVGIWTVLNLCLTGFALGAVSEIRERRSAPRVRSRLAGEIAIGDESIKAQIENMSFGGFRARLSGPVNIAARSTGVLRVKLSDGSGRTLETPIASLGRRVSGEYRTTGFRFYGLNADRFRVASLAMFSDIGRLYADRKSGYVRFGVALGSIYFVASSVRQAGRGLFYLLFKRNRPGAPMAVGSTEASVG